MKNLTNEQAAHALSYKTANLLADLDSNFSEHEGDLVLLAPKANPIFTGTVTVPHPPTNANDAATKAYVDAVMETGINWVDPVEDIVAVPPSPGVLGERYIRSTDDVILTNTAPDTWTETEPTAGMTTFVMADDDVPANEIGWYNFNGTDWVYIGASGNHNDLQSIDGGGDGEYYHMTAAQHTIATQAATAILSGYLSSANWTTFNNKAPTANPTFTGTVTVPDASFTYAKLQDASANVVLGRTGTAGDVEEITCTAVGRSILDDATTAAVRTTIGLGNVDNTSDLNKPLSTATTAALLLKANLASPALTGMPTAPTAALGTSTTQLATTAFVANGLALKANIASPALTGIPTAPTAVVGTNTTQIATTAFVQSAVGGGGGGQYYIFTDGVDTFRIGVRDTYFVLDQTITEDGFGGAEDTDWANITAQQL